MFCSPALHLSCRPPELLDPLVSPKGEISLFSNHSYFPFPCFLCILRLFFLLKNRFQTGLEQFEIQPGLESAHIHGAGEPYSKKSPTPHRTLLPFFFVYFFSAYNVCVCFSCRKSRFSAGSHGGATTFYTPFPPRSCQLTPRWPSGLCSVWVRLPHPAEGYPRLIRTRHHPSPLPRPPSPAHPTLLFFFSFALCLRPQLVVAAARQEQASTSCMQECNWLRNQKGSALPGVFMVCGWKA